MWVNIVNLELMVGPAPRCRGKAFTGREQEADVRQWRVDSRQKGMGV
jgi:hypothetical protein